MPSPVSLKRDISPPPTRRTSTKNTRSGETLPTKALDESNEEDIQPTLAAIEAGEAQIRDHLAFFSEHLGAASRHTAPSVPRLGIEDFQALYRRNQHARGRHFVVHQHDHPISGVHYDLRLQFSKDSNISFAVPYGLPGNPNSFRPNRMAIETRVHNLWNNLIESASHATGSLLIWDTGEYEVLPYREPAKARTTDDELSDVDQEATEYPMTDSEKLFAGFRERHIRLRLHGKRLPPGYTIGLRLPSGNDANGQPKKPKHKRRRTDPATATRPEPTSTDSEGEQDQQALTPSADPEPQVEDDEDAGLASESDNEDDIIRANNAYTGATNTIGSIHQRHWFLSLDRKNSGFRKARSGPDEGRWIDGWDPFYVLGRDHERSVVTGRLADDVMEDEGVKKFVGRKMWRPITE